MTSVDERTLTLDDFFQLQALLNYEQEARNQHIKQCAGAVHVHPVHARIHRAIDPEAALRSKLEKARLSEALFKLKWLKEQYRRERTMEIQLYLEHYRRQALIRAVLQEEEERYYRQCIAAALEQRRVQACLQNYLDIKRQQELQSQFEAQQVLKEKCESEQQTEEDGDNAGYTEYHRKQLEALLKHIFNFENQEEHQIACKRQAKSEEEQALAMAEVWKCLSDQKISEETPRSAFLSSDHDALLGIATQQVQNDEKEEDVRADNNKSPTTDEQESNFPPVQDHVVSLQELINQLASEPVLVDEMKYSDEPKPSGIWAKQTPSPNPKESPPPKDEEKKEEVPYLPQHIFTEAEPTPILEDMPDTPLEVYRQEDKNSFLPQHIFTDAEPTPKLEHMPNTCDPEEESEDQEAQHFVDSVAAELKNEVVPPDPRKVKAYEELDAISHLLAADHQGIIKRWKNVLNGGKDGNQSLSFAKQKEGTLLLTASTELNREFLGSEDELMRIMLRLDAIDSLGDKSIREERKKLVKKCESMLENLDNFKQTQWEKAMKQHQQTKKIETPVV